MKSQAAMEEQVEGENVANTEWFGKHFQGLEGWVVSARVKLIWVS